MSEIEVSLHTLTPVKSENLCDGDFDIFHQINFFQLHNAQNDRSAYITSLVANHNPPKLGIAFNYSELVCGIYRSPRRGPYGGIYCSRETSFQDVEFFLDSILSELSSKNAQSLEIVLPPIAYNPNWITFQFNLLLRKGFKIIRDELNYSIHVSKSVDFLSIIDHGNRKRIAKSMREGLVAVQLPPERYREAYNVICENRQRKGYPISMTWSALNEMIQMFPQKTLVHGVLLEDQLLAASISFEVNNKIRYVFYWGDKDDMSNLSPITLLAKKLYEDGQEKGITLLDLGTASLEGVPNYGLIRYKENLGATVSGKYFLRKEFASERP